MSGLTRVLWLAPILVLAARPALAQEIPPLEIPAELQMEIESELGPAPGLVPLPPPDAQVLGPHALGDALPDPTEAILEALEAPGVDRFPVVIVVNKSRKGTTAQSMYVFENGREMFRFKVSTGREKWETAKSGKKYFTASPRPGHYQPKRLVRKHYSKTWHADLHWMIFFNGGVGIHATTPDHYAELGTAASGGCVRLHFDHAKALFALVSEHGNGSVPAIVNRKIQLKADGTPVMAKNKPNTLIVMIEKQD